MDDAYRAYYSRVFKASKNWPGMLPATERTAHFHEAEALRAAVLEVTDKVRQQLGNTLREDAQLFLFLNAWQLLLRPILEVRELPPEEVIPDIRDDLYQLVRLAAANSPTREISGHRVVNALSESWSTLRLTRWQIWED